MAVSLFLRFPDQDDEILHLENEQHLLERIIKPAIAISDDIRHSQKQAALFYDRQNIEIFLEKIVNLYEPKYFAKPRTLLQEKLRKIGENWRDKPFQILNCLYVSWDFVWGTNNFAISSVVNTILSEITERILRDQTGQYLLANMTERPFQRKYWPIFKDAPHDDSLPRFVHIPVIYDYEEWLLWWNFYREKTGLAQFSLLDKERFRKTDSIIQGKSVYKEIATGYFWYLDNFHKNEYEVCDAQGKHIGVADLDGTIDCSQAENDRHPIKVN